MNIMVMYIFLTAQREFLKAHFPFDDPTTANNLGYIGRGYDIYHGNPLPDNAEIDQGFRLLLNIKVFISLN